MYAFDHMAIVQHVKRSMNNESKLLELNKNSIWRYLAGHEIVWAAKEYTMVYASWYSLEKKSKKVHETMRHVSLNKYI